MFSVPDMTLPACGSGNHGCTGATLIDRRASQLLFTISASILSQHGKRTCRAPRMHLSDRGGDNRVDAETEFQILLDVLASPDS